MHSEDDQLAPGDIGTSNDTGSLDPHASGEYSGEQVDEYDSFEGLAHAIAHGTLKERVLEQPDDSKILITLVYQMLERVAASIGDPVAAVEQLCFEPDSDDLYDGARIQCRNGYIIAHDGTHQKVLKYDSPSRMLAKFVMAGSYVLAGMIRTLSAI